MRVERCGWRAKVGLLTPTLHLTIMREWDVLLPEGVTCHPTIMGLTEGTPEGMRELKGKAVAEVKKLTRDGLVDLILFACTSGSFVGGAGYDQEIIRELEAATGVPVTTTSTCVLAAFRDVGVKRIALIGPYVKEFFDIEIQFFEDQGIETLYCKGMGYADEMAKRVAEQPYIYYRWVKEAHRSAPGADAIFVTCMHSPILKVVSTLEQETGKPVISSCSAALYGVLKQLGIKDPVEGYGQLLRIPR